ncbi:hypothetical protein TCAL_04034 [Tigriopus californicus]|uniref:U3 small nucleolar ribonucleoprotein protein MPP10 n=1 Tax=Tigriopus californicus TaxID=6832 RepID=A0A553PGJ3_TIGCA|nr:hypothetical protein TCAL_04034 [Tigriopus californicus]|eukprot:TCALIF_04034-PA protein Name:"Similar to MPHOSPH10 U3 small nucleolar ribonucleoprotein protein MPP10 (Homo sapiens)" AED:0.05 eAED:0.06 QI:0/0/0/1/1/1/2/0/617
MEAILSQTRSKVQSLIAKPEQFLQSPKESLILTSQSITKILYDLAKLNEDPEDQSGKAKSTLKELIIEGFDHEQIWAQIQLQNEATLPSLQKQIWLWENGPKEWNLLAGTKRVQNKRKLELENGIDLEDPKKGKYEEPQDDTDEDDLNGMNDMNDPIQEAETDDDYDSEKEAEEEEVDLEDDQEENEEDAIFNDPDFQNMSDSDGDDLPLFENAKSEDEASEDEEEREKKELERETKKKAIDSQADDYLAKAMSSIRQKKTEVDDDFFKLNDMASFLDQEDQKEDRRRMREERGLENDDDDDDDDGIDLFDDIAGPARPENSLLQEHLDYETVAKQAPIITEAVSKRLEDIILRRIKDKAWDDVERKIKPVEDPYEYKKRLVLDQEKSKLSLAEVYEQDYLKKKSDLENADKTSGVLDREDEDDPKEVEAIKASMHALFAKLNTLTHFHYTPQNVNTDVKIVKNVPAIAIEEVAPISHSDAALLAPQEMLEKGGKRELELDATEKTETDRKRERRKKKTKQRAIRKDKEQREKLVNKLNPGLGNKYSKEKMKKELQRAEKKGEITSLKDKGQAKGVKSSSAFFNQLQEETHNVVKRAKEESQKQKNKASSKASKFKL